MTNFDLHFPEIADTFPMVWIKGTGGNSYLFGDELTLNIQIRDFYVSKYLVPQRLWEYVMGSNPADAKGSNRPVETVSFHDVTSENGFLQKLNGLDKTKKATPEGLVLSPAFGNGMGICRKGWHKLERRLSF